METAKQPVGEVDRAVAAHRRALTRLIGLLKHKEMKVRDEAGTALLGLDPPPVQALLDAILESKDRPFQVRCIGLLESMAPAAWVQVGMALGAILVGVPDSEVHRSVIQAGGGLRRLRVDGEARPRPEF